MVKRRVPNVVRGGTAIPLKGKTNYYYMSGRKHSQGGIDIGEDPRTGLEVEGGEVMHIGKNDVKVFSSVPFLNGESPAEKVMRGDNPNAVFNAQEDFKKRNKINDDGTRKAQLGTKKKTKDTYRSSDAIRKRISDWEGASMATNRPFEQEDSLFYNSIPDTIRTKLSQDELDALYSYSYNVGAPRFKKRTVPALINLVNEIGSVEDVQKAMWAKLDNDPKYPGLAKRREIERQLFADVYNKRIAEANKPIDAPPVKDIIAVRDNTYVDRPDVVSPIERRKRIGGRVKAQMGIYDDIDNITEKAEPWVGGTSLALTGITAAAPNPVTAWGAAIANGLGAGIDAYQAGRNFYKGNYKEGLINTGEALLSLAGIKLAKYLAKTRGGKQVGNLREQLVDEAYRARQKNKRFLLRKGLSEEKAAEIVFRNAVNAVNNSADFRNAKKEIEDRNNKGATNAVVIGDAIMDANDVRKGLNKDNNSEFKMGGLSRSKYYGSNSKPYPSVKGGDFAGGNRSYPIPTKADAVDALRLAGLHGRSDVKAKVYRKYPELRKKSAAGGLYSVTSGGKTRLYQFPSTGERPKAKLGHGSFDRMLGVPRAYMMMRANGFAPPKKENKASDEYVTAESPEYNNKEFEYETNTKQENVGNTKQENVGKSYHTISQDKSTAALRGIARKLNYNFSEHGNHDFRTADVSNAVFTNRPDTIEHITSIYGNDFVAANGSMGSTRRARDFRNENKSKAIDNKIPVEKISRYYGNDKSGKLVIGSLDDFEDNGYIAAVRNKSMPFNDVKIENGKLVYYADGKPIKSSLPEGENNKHIVYNKETGKKQFVSTTKSINDLYNFYKQFLADNKGYADIVLMDNGRFEDNIYKGGRNLTDEEISDYYRNDFVRKGGFSAVPVLVQRGKKSFGGSTKIKRAKADWGTDKSTSAVGAPLYSIFGPKYDRVVTVTPDKTSFRSFAWADPNRPTMSYFDLANEGYFDGYGMEGFSGRRIPYTPRQKSEDVTITNPATINFNSNNTKPAVRHSTTAVTPSPSTDPVLSYSNTNLGKITTPTFSQYKINPVIKDTINRPINTTSPVEETEKTNWLKRTLNSFNNPNVEDAIGFGAGAIGSLISHRINKNMLDDLKYHNQPVARTAAKLKTRININPQLDKMRESLAAYERDIDNNTASSRVALARKQRGRLANAMSTNELYGNKENIETELINKDRLNQQAVAHANVADYNKWLEGKAAFENAVREKKSENDVSLVQNLNSGLQDLIGRRQKRRNENQTITAMALANPNLPIEVFHDQGLVNDRTYNAYMKAYRNRNKKKQG